MSRCTKFHGSPSNWDICWIVKIFQQKNPKNVNLMVALDLNSGDHRQYGSSTGDHECLNTVFMTVHQTVVEIGHYHRMLLTCHHSLRSHSISMFTSSAVLQSHYIQPPQILSWRRVIEMDVITSRHIIRQHFRFSSKPGIKGACLWGSLYISQSYNCSLFVMCCAAHTLR